MSEAEVPVSTVPIPDEAYNEALRAAAAYRGSQCDHTFAIAHETVRAAAPFVARAAQVQVLREMAAKLEEHDRRLMLDCPCWDKAADRVRERADELEAER